MTCRALIDILDDYLDGALPPVLVSELEAHLAGCAPCRAYLATYAKTRELGPRAAVIDMPEEMVRRLRSMLAARLGLGPAL